MKKEINVERLKESLNERYSIYVNAGERKEDMTFYKGMLQGIEQLGLSWDRKEGKHYIY